MKHSLFILALAATISTSPVAAPQAVTAVIAPPAPPPADCQASYPGSFGIVAMKLVDEVSEAIASTATLIPDGQLQVTSLAATTTSIGEFVALELYRVADGFSGQIQVATAVTIPATSDEQLEGSMPTIVMLPVGQISDGQIQAYTSTIAVVTVISDGQPQAPAILTSASAGAVSVISDGQPQAPTATSIDGVVSIISDGQPQVPTISPTDLVTVVVDGQPQAPNQTVTGFVSAVSDGQPEATGLTNTTMVGCSGSGVLSLSLLSGVLKDPLNRIGYIASNRQFQFDDPPQAGAIFTAGFSMCGNNSLALGGSAVFYQCLSGTFYNLYDQSIGGQCSPVFLRAVPLVGCGSS